MMTVHAPHWPSPHPKRGPFSSMSLRSTYSSGVVGSVLTVRDAPFTVSVIEAIASPSVVRSPNVGDYTPKGLRLAHATRRPRIGLIKHRSGHQKLCSWRLFVSWCVRVSWLGGSPLPQIHLRTGLVLHGPPVDADAPEVTRGLELKKTRANRHRAMIVIFIRLGQEHISFFSIQPPFRASFLLKRF